MKPKNISEAYFKLINVSLKSFEKSPTILILHEYSILKVLEKSSGEKTKLFALILTQHRLWGTVLMPYIVIKDSKSTYFRMSEALSPFPNIDTLATLAPEEREVVNILNEYTDRILFKLFSKNASVKEFLEKVTPDRIEDFIRPYIETRIYRCFSVARDEAIQVFLQKGRISTIHLEDRIDLCGDTARPVFWFHRDNEQSTYSLSLEISGKIINLRKGTIDIICNSPCLIREDSNIIFISDVDGSKLKPFITREHILIPKNAEEKYFSSFVLNAINNFRVEGTGFRIIEEKPVKEAVLEIESGLKGSPVLTLKYRYPGYEIFPTDSATSFTRFLIEDNIYTYHKYYRDFDWESGCVNSLAEIGFYTDDDVNFALEGLSGDGKQDLYDTIEAVNRVWNDLINSGFRISSNNLEKKYNLRPISLGISHRIIDDWFDLKAVVKIGEYEIPFVRFRRNILDGIREFELPDGSVAILPEAWFARYKNIFEFGKSEDDSLLIHKQHFSLLPDTFDEDECVGCDKLEKLIAPENIPHVVPPAGLNGEMRNYQIEGLAWMYWLQSANLGGCLADDMGLGKTIQTLALLLHNRENLPALIKNPGSNENTLFEEPAARLTSLIVVPASLVYNWENEIKRFVPEMKVCSYKGNQRKKSTSYFHQFDVILSSYHTIRQDIDIISLFNFHYVVLDESQVIKNPASMIFRTVIRLKSDYRLVLTGTPVENSLTDLWTQLNFVNPGLLGSLAFFRREYAKPIEKKKDDDKEIQLRKIIKPFILRRTKEMVANDLPPVTEQTKFCNMTEEQAELYEKEKSAVRNSILKNIETSGREKSAIVVLQGLMKLRQISNHPMMAYSDYPSGSGKFETVVQDIESVISEGHKILVFSSFVKHLDLYADVLTKKRIRYSILTGASTNRERIINSFQNDAVIKVFLISLKAGGVGLNLTAADYVFILDPWWNPAAEIQALNRAHRIGQDKSVFVYRYISSDTIEEKITRLQEKKSRLADTFVHSNNPLKDIDINQILEIIG
jgi:SNF2 family DNA or RNA helicase